MRTAPRQQQDFYDEVVYSQLLPEEDELLAIRDGVDFSFVEEETQDLYSAVGRPAYPASVLFKMLFLEYYANLSDVQVGRQCKYNLLYRAFLGLSVGQKTPDDTTLVVFRRRLGEERFRRLFDRVVAQCQAARVTRRRRKIVDATHVIASVAVPNAVSLLRQGRRRVVRAIEKKEGHIREDLRSRFHTDEPLRVASAETLQEEVDLSEALLDEARYYGEGVEEEVRLLSGILNPSEGGKITSVVDPEARFGHKGPSKTFVGYKIHVAEDSSELVTSLDVLGGNEHEGHRLPELLAQEESKGVLQRSLVADALYDSLANRRLVADMDMVGYIPLRRPNSKNPDFNYDPGEKRLKCPAGEYSVGRVRQVRGTLHIFSRRQCAQCGDRSLCPPLNKQQRVRVYLSDDHLFYWSLPTEGMAQAQHDRKRIERKFGEAKQWHGLGRTRYRGKAKMAIQALITFLVINTKRMVKLLNGRDKPISTVSA